MIDPLRDFPLVRDGYRKGLREGIRKGEVRGETRGETRGQARSLLTLLEARDIKVSAAMRTKIFACTDAATLDRWLKKAVHAASIAEVLRAQ